MIYVDTVQLCGGVSEYFLYHGSDEDALMRIREEGFDPARDLE